MNKSTTDTPRTDAAKPKLTRESYDEDWNLKTENDTPRTDEQIWTTCFDHRSCDVVDMEFARQLERELAQSLENQVKSQVEIEFWKAKAYEAEHSQGKHEAEVERLKAKLCRAIEIADVLRGGGSLKCRELHHAKKDQHEYGGVCPVEERLKKAGDELDQLKATINQEIHDHWKVFLEKQLAYSLANQVKFQAEVERLRAINADTRNFLSKAIHNEGFNEDQALKFIYQ